MLYSPQRGVVILQVPKTGTVAFSKGLRGVCPPVRDMPRHVSANQARSFFGKEKWAELETVAVVREPVSWLQSWYKYLNSRGRLGSDLTFSSFVEIAATDDSFNGARLNVRSQFDRLSDGRQKRVIVTRLLCFEQLASEYASLNSELFGGEGAPLKKANVSAQKVTEIDSEVQGIVRQHWSRDLAIWQRTRARANQKYGAALAAAESGS